MRITFCQMHVPNNIIQLLFTIQRGFRKPHGAQRSIGLGEEQSCPVWHRMGSMEWKSGIGDEFPPNHPPLSPHPSTIQPFHITTSKETWSIMVPWWYYDTNEIYTIVVVLKVSLRKEVPPSQQKSTASPPPSPASRIEVALLEYVSHLLHVSIPLARFCKTAWTK